MNLDSMERKFKFADELLAIMQEHESDESTVAAYAKFLNRLATMVTKQQLKLLREANPPSEKALEGVQNLNLLLAAALMEEVAVQLTHSEKTRLSVKSAIAAFRFKTKVGLEILTQTQERPV